MNGGWDHNNHPMIAPPSDVGWFVKAIDDICNNGMVSHGMVNNGMVNTITRRKFRSQTSDNMDRWKSRGGKSQRGEEKK